MSIAPYVYKLVPTHSPGGVTFGAATAKLLSLLVTLLCRRERGTTVEKGPKIGRRTQVKNCAGSHDVYRSRSAMVSIARIRIRIRDAVLTFAQKPTRVSLPTARKRLLNV